MNKWYHPFGLLLLAAMLGDLSGCTQIQALAKKSSKKQTEQEIAAAEKKLNDKTPKKKSSSEVADSKSSKSKDSKGLKDSKLANDSKSKEKDVKTASATKSKAKAIDAEHEKFTAAETAKKKKPTTEARVGKESDEVAVAGSAKPTKPAAKPKAAAAEADDSLYSFVEKMESTTTPPAKKVAKPVDDADFEAVAETKASARKNVVQVKKEVAKIEENDDIADWTDTAVQPNSKSVKSAIASDPTEDEIESPFAESEKAVAHAGKPGKSEPSHAWDEDLAEAKSNESKHESESDLFEEKPAVEKKVAVTRVSEKKVAEKKSGSHRDAPQGLSAMCPQAEGELRDVLSGMNATDAESLKQGLHRIGQLGAEGRAADPLLRKMLKHEDAFVRVHAALAMARLNLTTGESVAVVTASLKARDASLRSFSVAVLDEMGPQASEVLESLAVSLNDRDGQIRLRSAEVLIRHDEWSLQALQCLLSCLTEKDENVRWLATYSFAELAPQSPEAVQALMKATGDPASKVRVGAVYALGEIGPYAKRSVGELQRLMNSTKDEELKSAISYSLQQIEK